MRGSSGPSMACSLGSPVQWAEGGLAEHCEFSGLLLSCLVSVAVYVRAVGKAPPPSLSGMRTPAFLRGESFFLPSFFCCHFQARSSLLPPSVPCFRFLRLVATELLSSLASRFPALRSTAAVVGGILICQTPQLQSSATGLRIVVSSSPLQSPLQSLHPQQFLLSSVSHWCRSFCTVKRPTSGC